MKEAAMTPLIDLLRDVPAGARVIYEHSPTHHQQLMVGQLCKEAADEIEGLRERCNILRAELEAARAELQDQLKWASTYCARADRYEAALHRIAKTDDEDCLLGEREMTKIARVAIKEQS